MSADAFEVVRRLGARVEIVEPWEVRVEPRHSTRNYGKPDIDVLASPALIGLIEEAAIRILDPHLPEGLTSVGTRVDFWHLKSTPIGAVILINAAIRSVEKRFVHFTVEALADGAQIARCDHTRAVIASPAIAVTG